MENEEMNRENPEQIEPVPESAVQEVAPQETPAPQEKKLPVAKIALCVTAVIVLVAILAAILTSGNKKAEAPAEEMLPGMEDAANLPAAPEAEEAVEATIPADGNPDDVTCKGSYTASDSEVEAQRDTVVATAGENQLTLGQLQIYYWMEVRNFLNNYGGYAAYLGLDYTQPLDTQTCTMSEIPMTWQQFFLDMAINSWGSYQSMSTEADKAGMVLSDELAQMVARLEEDLDASAVANGFTNGEEVLHNSLGGAASMADYVHFMELYYHGYEYYKILQEKVVPTAEEVAAFYEEHQEAYEAQGISKDAKYVDVRHILVYPEGADGASIRTEEFPEEAWTAGEEKAQAILDEWMNGEKTEESFGQLANQYSQDPGSNTNGGLYADVSVGTMVENFNNWCFDESRQIGDTGVVRTEYGFHVMYFSGSRPVWEDNAKNDLSQERYNAILDEVADMYPLDVDYSKILLCAVTLE